jgi:hypothetical protein
LPCQRGDQAKCTKQHTAEEQRCSPTRWHSPESGRVKQPGESDVGQEARAQEASKKRGAQRLPEAAWARLDYRGTTATAYAIGEGRKRRVGLSRKPKETWAFYGVLASSVALGVALNFTAIDPIKALYWSAVINGVLAAPVMIIMMLLVRRKSVMGDLVVKGPVYWLGWVSTAAMGLCIVGTAASMRV